jgi:uncharacterized protein (DUF1330 family)
MAVYLMGLIDIHDPETYQGYADGFDWEHFHGLGGECLIVDDAPEVIEGDWSHGRLVLLRFPSREVLQTWYDSEEYGRVRGIRWANATSSLSVHPEVVF